MPNNLVCNASSCASNNGGLCQASKIQIKGAGAHIEGETRCATYSENNVENNLKNVFNTNYTGIVGQDLFDGAPVHPKVACSANTCKHNSRGECSKNSLQIFSNSTGDTSCSSFELK